MIKFNGKEYPSRTFEVICEGEERQYTISTESLSEAMGDDKEKHGTEANNIDNEIYFYVEDEVINLPAEEICKNHLDVEMVLFKEIFGS